MGPLSFLMPKGVTFDNFRGDQSFNFGCLPLFSKGGATWNTTTGYQKDPVWLTSNILGSKNFKFSISNIWLNLTKKGKSWLSVGMVSPSGPFYEKNLVKFQIFLKCFPIVMPQIGCELS